MRLVLLLLTAFFSACEHRDSPRAAAEPAASARGAAPQFDLLIHGGEVIDGTGAPRFRADVGIRGDTIVAVGHLDPRKAAMRIDATGRVVTPGFIDLLGNSEGAVLIDPRVEGKVRQGITTEVTGEGHSPGPIDDAMAAEMNRTRPPGFPEVRWRSLAEYMSFLEGRGSAINFAFYVGATNAREIVLGDDPRAPTSAELQQMKEIVATAMQQGAVGLSSALIYRPGSSASTEELIALARVAGEYGGSYWTHMRNEADRIDEAIDEAVRIGREARLPVNVFHLKIGGTKNRGKMSQIVRKLEAARAAGVDIAANVYPYTATSTDLTSIVPKWALEGGYLAFVARLRDPAQRARIRTEIEAGAFVQRYDGGKKILVRRIPDGRLKHLEKRYLSDAARELNTDPIDAALRIFESTSASPTGIYFSLEEEDLRVALSQPWVALGSDSGSVVGTARQSGAHPRAYGTFPRVLGHYVRDVKLFTLEEAVRKVTSLAAARAGLRDRGIIRSGMKADVVVFDPDEIRDRSTYEDPHHFSVGIDHVIVNGAPVLRDGTMTGKLPGRVLRRAATSSSPAPGRT